MATTTQGAPRAPEDPASLAALLSRDPAASDMLLTLCCAAANSYRQDTALRPFPPPFVQAAETLESERDVAALREALVTVPRLQPPPSQRELQRLPQRTRSLLAWLTSPSGLRLRAVDAEATVRKKRAEEECERREWKESEWKEGVERDGKGRKGHG